MDVMSCLTLKDLITAKKSKVDQVMDERSAQKENLFERFRISPRAALKAEPIDLSKQKCFTPERIPVTPVKISDRPLAEPWTPTANLKMLISVASPEIRDREKRKELFRPIENNEQDEVVPETPFDGVDDLDELEKRPSRKQKSLGLLCQKFLARYPSYPMSTEKMTISLDEAASSLGVERRRIYDIVNVLESLHLVSRVAKNQYCWNGQCNLNETLQRLQMDGEKQKYGAQIAYFQQKDLGVKYKLGEGNETSTENRMAPFLEFSEADCTSASASSRKDKSLRIMSKKFVMLFLVSTTKIITLEIAAKILIEESQDAADHSKFKTKVRRLYDIANVLTSLGLIKKVHVTEERGRKPAFKWIGPVDFVPDNEQRMEVTSTTPSPNSKSDSSVIVPSFSKTQSSDSVKRKICCEPSKPRKVQKVCIQDKDSYASKMARLAAICRQEVEDSKNNHCESMRNGVPLPFSVVLPVPMDTECPVQPGLSVSQKRINGHIAASQSEPSNHGFLPNQPYMYVPSSSVLMLCGNLPKEKALDPASDGQTTLDLPKEAASKSPASDNKHLKRQCTDAEESPLSLVLPKKISRVNKNAEFESAPPHKSPNHEENSETVTMQTVQQKMLEDKDGLKNNEQENLNPSALPQYLYVPSGAGLNGFSFLLPASQAAGALGISQSHLASLNVPYVMVPSTALSSFPFFCSHTVPNSLPSVSSPGGMNYNPPTVTPSSHLMISTQSAPPHEPSTDPRPNLPAMNGKPLPTSSAASVNKESPVSLGQPILSLQKSPSPSTPKNIRPVHKGTFFETPGSAQASVSLRKSEGTRSRTSSSAQRRLEIGSSASD
ncbi:transcription factor E2F7 [Spea bombifrons]|uniref:transcription factor E2F7 n=1 Tax=Spea bombifrons TaxID=233779 RepID=UPI00234A2E53|nr:transcription factor E2F7 [Spea bombifrons]